MPSSTIYDIKLRYLMEDRASRGVSDIGNRAESAAKKTGFLGSSLRRVAGFAMANFGLNAVSKHFIGFNSNMEQAKTTMAGMIQLNLGGEWNENLTKSNDLIEEFQRRAKKSVGTTADFVNMASMITRPVTAAGLGMKELADITAGAAISARAFGIQTETAALDIEQALAGTVGKKDRFAVALLGPIMKMRELTLKQFNGLGPEIRAQMLLEAFNSKTLKDMAKAQSKTFAGAYSTFQDSMQRFAGTVGKPLFEALTVQLGELSLWMDANQDKVAEFATSLGGALKTGFGYMKDALSFLFSHRDLIMTIAKTALIMKATSFGLGKFSALAEWGHGLTNNTTKLSVFTGKLGNVINKLGMAAPAVAGVYLGAKAVAHAIDKRQDRQIAEKVKYAVFDDRVKEFNDLKIGNVSAISQSQMTTRNIDLPQYTAKVARQVLMQGKAAGLYDGSGSLISGVAKSNFFNEEDIAQIRKAQEYLRNHLYSTGDAFRDIQMGISAFDLQPVVDQFAALGRGLYDSFSKSWGEWLPFGGDTKKKLSKGKGAKTKVQVTINKIEVQSDDPDRFTFQLLSTVEDTLNNRGSAFDALPEG